jgi:hypothetical protein
MNSKVEFREDENPRWTMCRAAIGREPEVWEFTLWTQQRWRDYAVHLGLADLAVGVVTKLFSDSGLVTGAWSSASTRISSWYWFEKGITDAEMHKLFDQWLKSEVESGKYKEV